MAFLAIQCPSCASTDVTLRGGGNYECNHCSTSFVRKQQPQAPPPPPQPRPLNVPVNSYGPQVHAPTVAPVQVQVTAPRRTGCMSAVIMLFAFGVPLVGAGASFWQSHRATQAGQTAAAEAMARVTGTPTKPKPPTQVVLRTSRSTLTAPSEPSKEPDEPTSDAPDSQPNAAGEGTSLDMYQELKGCSCRAKVGPVNLHLRAAGGGTTVTASGTRSTMKLSFAAKAGSGTPFTLPTTSKTAPATEYTRGRFPLGMGCAGDTLVIAAERSVTAWSLGTRTAQWTQTLPQTYGNVRPSETPSLDCKSLSVSGGAVSVRAGGKTIRLDLKSGELEDSKGGSKPNSGSRKPLPTEPKAPDPAPAPDEPTPEPADSKPTPPESDPKTDPEDGKKKKGKKKKGKKKKGKKKKGKKKP
ncbi:MAG: hypothetical protein KUG77_05765 [Nannocystaceae bacterium]|nr:hypothetical protein [Nannocystaceae bacterium]